MYLSFLKKLNSEVMSTEEFQMQENHEDEDERMHENFNHLQEQWDSFNKSNPPRRHLQRSSTDTKSILKLNNASASPTNLCPSVEQQISCSPLEGEWKVRTNELAVLEILNERKAVIVSGKMKGRRLFSDSESVDEAYFSEVMSSVSNDDGDVDDDYVSSSCTSMDMVENENGLAVTSYAEEKKVVNGDGRGLGKWTHMMFRLATVLMALVLGIMSLCCFDGFIFTDQEDLYDVFPT